MRTRTSHLKHWLMILGAVFALQAFAQQLIERLNANQTKSTIKFSGEHAGMPFEGVFEKWDATLTLPPAQNPEIAATFYLASAKTGDRTYDSTLPEGDWFDIENTPQGRFVSTQIQASAQGRYAVKGELTLRGISKPVAFEMINTGEQLIADIIVQRLAYNIGLESDPDAEWVSAEINIKLRIAI